MIDGGFLFLVLAGIGIAVMLQAWHRSRNQGDPRTRAIARRLSKRLKGKGTFRR